MLLLLVVFELIRSRRLRERYALLWLLTGVVLLVLSLWRGGLNTIAGWFGISGYPPAILFAVGILFILLVLLHYSTVISRLSDQSTILAQRLALLEERFREERDQHRSAQHDRVDHAVRGRREHEADLVAVDPVGDEDDREQRSGDEQHLRPSREQGEHDRERTRTSHSVGSKRCSATARSASGTRSTRVKVELGAARHVVQPAPREPRQGGEEREREPARAGARRARRRPRAPRPRAAPRS